MLYVKQRKRTPNTQPETNTTITHRLNRKTHGRMDRLQESARDCSNEETKVRRYNMIAVCSGPGEESTGIVRFPIQRWRRVRPILALVSIDLFC